MLTDRTDRIDSLAVKNPKLSKEWHLTKNGQLTPKDVTSGSHKKVWWKCENEHEWQASIANRVNGRGCPFCSNKRVYSGNSLYTLNSVLAGQWHPIKNGNLTPKDVTLGSDKKVWWQCEKGHVWKAVIYHRTKGSGCPYCSGLRACDDNCLQSLNPELAKEWHPIKNGNLTPKDVTPGSDKKVWWQCKKRHEWQGRISHRVNGIGCPECNIESQTSFPEQAIFFYLKSVFSDTLNRYKYHNKWEIDVFVPSLNFGIEYDGIYYHKENKTSDFEKEKYVASENIFLLRVKETNEKIINCYCEDNIIYCSKSLSEIQLNEVIEMCFKYLSKNVTCKPYTISANVKADRAKIYESYIIEEKKKSFFSKFPDFSKQWHPTKNLSIKPDMVTANSSKKVWWQCEKGHEWEAIIANRAKGGGCPFCAGKKTCLENSLQTLNPNLAKQWHPTKNGDLTPSKVTTGSNKKVWWQCEKGHEWKATINQRSSGYGCPYCSNQRACVDNCLQTLNPKLSKQWHPTKNGDLTPKDVMPYSNKKVWWKCEKGNEWEAFIAKRSIGRGCPYCKKMKNRMK